MKTRTLAALLALPASLVVAADPADHQVTATTANGISVRFTPTTEPKGASRLPEGGVIVGHGVDRFVVDREAGLYFGYNLAVEAVPGSRKLRVSVRPLSSSAERRLREMRSLTPLASAPLPAYPGAQFVEDGDTMALDLLVHEKTGVKIVDLLTISNAEPARQKMATAAPPPLDFRLEDVELRMTDYRLLVNGQPVFSGAGISGPLLGFFRPGRGTFVLSLVSRSGYSFQKAGAIAHDKVTFSVSGDTYEWISTSPVVGSGGNWNVWVLFEPGSEPRGVLRTVSPASNDAAQYVIGAAGNVESFLAKR